MRRPLSAACAVAALQLIASSASANTESVVSYDARSSAMGFTGAAFVDNTTAIMHNPANLTDIKRLSMDVSFNPEILKLSSQVFNGTSSQAASTDFVFAPLGFAGVAYKVHPRLVVGAAGLIMDAGGVKYSDAPQSIFGNPTPTDKGTALGVELSYELRVPVAVKITEWLSVSGAYRMTFANQFTSFKVNGLARRDQSVSGVNYASAQAGLMVRPMRELQFGLNYRSRTKVNMTGSDAASASLTPLVATYVAPHHFDAGVAVRLLNERLLVSGNFKYWMYADAYAGQHNHQDAMSGHLGGEYWVTPRVPVRVGYFVGRSSVPDEAASAFTSSPKLQMGGSVGSGVKFDVADINASVFYGGAGGSVTQNVFPGHYGLHLVGLGVSASFHI